ncbi:monooxygenase 1-like isoform X2 [Mercurialis annua]|uniref:monooxygenase 1-like isoform X2 n=1 Tax=Mercurialis annua TaxID=3986 RepID=UPI00215ED4D1|nr:monooxygenase 1-like isoform X2 [Mercurialis annua]
MDAIEEVEIVIVGGGICGLATALALHRFVFCVKSLIFMSNHDLDLIYNVRTNLKSNRNMLNRKGIRSVVLERSETLRETGSGIAILTNGWRALDELGVGSKIRPTALPVQRVGEARCVKRSDLINAMADELPLGAIRFGCDIISVNLDSKTSFPVLQLSNGSSIKAKALIGCDGSNSIVADFLELKPKRIFALCAVRGFTNYPNGHGFAPDLTRMIKGEVLCGRVPVDENLVFWFIVQKFNYQGSKFPKDAELIRQFSLDSIRNFPTERLEMVKNCDVASLSLTQLRYRTPWEILLGKFRTGTVTVAGDAMHIMGPFIGQGGSAALEDAIVIARCLSWKMLEADQLEDSSKQIMSGKIGEAFEMYVKERRMRLVWLSAHTYLFGSLLETTSGLVKVMIGVTILVLFHNPTYHTRYDCGRL